MAPYYRDKENLHEDALIDITEWDYLEDNGAYFVTEIDREWARDFIMSREYLPNYPKSHLISYGLWKIFTDYPDEEGIEEDKESDEHLTTLIGAVSFTGPMTRQQANFVCGEEHADEVCVLGRGVCYPIAPQNASSYLIGKALKLLVRDTPKRIVIAYADRDAGEVGKVYQATNWIYTGMTDNNKAQFKIDGRWMHGRTARAYCKRNGFPNPSRKTHEWKLDTPKHRYITIIGDRPTKRKLMKVFKPRRLPYPKDDPEVPHIIEEQRRDPEQARLDIDSEGTYHGWVRLRKTLRPLI